MNNRFYCYRFLLFLLNYSKFWTLNTSSSGINWSDVFSPFFNEGSVCYHMWCKYPNVPAMIKFGPCITSQGFLVWSIRMCKSLGCAAHNIHEGYLYVPSWQKSVLHLVYITSGNTKFAFQKETTFQLYTLIIIHLINFQIILRFIHTCQVTQQNSSRRRLAFEVTRSLLCSQCYIQPSCKTTSSGKAGRVTASDESALFGRCRTRLCLSQ